MLSIADLPSDVMLIELRGVYDGWSIAQFPDGSVKNRWANDEGTGPEPGYERRYEATEEQVAYLTALRDGVDPEYAAAATSGA